MSAFSLDTKIEIDAAPETVWRILADFAAYPDWNPFVRSIEGTPERGARLKIRIQPSGTRGMNFQPQVLEASPHRELRWLGSLLMPGIFDGEHRFVIEPAG